MDQVIRKLYVMCYVSKNYTLLIFRIQALDIVM